jgi:hypothetical protein
MIKGNGLSGPCGYTKLSPLWVIILNHHVTRGCPGDFDEEGTSQDQARWLGQAPEGEEPDSDWPRLQLTATPTKPPDVWLELILTSRHSPRQLSVDAGLI